MECPQLIELLQVYLESDALDIERQDDDNDVPDENSNVPLDENKSIHADELNQLLNAYLDIYNPEAPECQTVIDDEDQVAQLIDQIITEIVDLLPDTKLVRINDNTFSSIFVYCESENEEENDDADQ